VAWIAAIEAKAIVAKILVNAGVILISGHDYFCGCRKST
jgi:hypothetical protein